MIDALSTLGDRHATGCWLFLRALGLVQVWAFASLAVQVEGLIGSRGILPAADLVRAAREQGASFLDFPTIFRWSASDRALSAACWAGVASGALVACDVAVLPSLLVAGALYVSLLNVSGVFLGYQWDVLLVETTFLAILVSPLRLLPAGPSSVSTPAVLALWWLVFRLMFSSGVVKLTSRDPTWRSLTAMTYHYETQPLPNPLSWRAHALPRAAHVATSALTFVVELGMPFLIFSGSPTLRAIAALSFAGLMLGIMSTGNYGFFNVLSIAPCLALVDDATWARLGIRLAASGGHALPWIVTLPIVVALVFLSLFPLTAMFRSRLRLPRALRAAYAAVSPFSLVNGYGLFAVMTTTRPEIIVEGSRDGVTWLPYELRWKPDDPRRRPRFCPHMPRLDWQAWFAALGTLRGNRWFSAFLARLLQGSPPVLKLLRTNPFPDEPPRYVRATLWDSRFTTPRERRETGAFWKRERLPDYARPMSLVPMQSRDAPP